MAEQAYNVTVSMSGTSTAFTGEATTNTSGKSYQITDADKRLLDPDTTPTVYDNASPVSASNIESIDYHFGIVTFTGAYSVTGPVTVDGDYYPLLEVAEGRSFDFNRVREMLETTIFGQSYRSRIAGLIDATLTVESLDTTDTDIDAGGGTQSWQKPWNDGTAVVLDVTIGTSSAKSYRLWAVEESPAVSASFDGLVNSTASFQLAAQTAADGTIVGVTAS